MSGVSNTVAKGVEEPRGEKPEPAGSGWKVTPRCVILGLLLVPLNVYWVIVSELRWYTILTINPLFVTPVFYLLMLLFANSALRRFAPRLVLKPAELVVIYIMLVMSCTIATHDFIINLMSSMGWARWSATPENGWEKTLFPHLPRWLLVWDKRLLSGYFNGNASLYDPGVLKMWIGPLAFWSALIFCMCWIMLCMTVILRKAWTEDVKLSFPIVRLPLAMTDPKDNILQSPALRAGVILAAAISLENGLHLWFPTLPDMQVRARALAFVNPPWTALSPMFISCYPFAIGLGFLVPLDVSFSCWFFYLFAKAQAFFGYQAGLGNVRDFPFLMEQGIGAWTAFGIALLYASRKHIANAVRIAVRVQDGSDAEEPLPYRIALWGLLAGMAFFFIFWWAAGMKPIWALLVMVLYLLLSICITRVRAEAGGQHTVWDLEPMNVFRLFDARLLGPSTLAAGAVSHWYWRLNRSHTMPSQMEAFKLAKEHNINLRSLVLPMLAALVLATVCGMWACLHVFYREGALAKCQGFAIWSNVESHTWLENGLNNGFHPEKTRWAAVGSAATFTFLLAWFRGVFTWFPFHPLGYCIGPGLIWLWFPFFIAWVLKLSILRYGGLKLYRKALPFFLGLVLGDYASGAVWSIIGIIWQVPTHQLFH